MSTEANLKSKQGATTLGGATPGDTLRSDPLLTALIVLLSGAFAWSYWPDFISTAKVWASDPDYSHGYLVGPLALLFLWVRRDRFALGTRRPAWEGLALIGFAILVRYLADRYYLYEIAAWSSVPWLVGACLLVGGWPFCRWVLPSAFFLFFAMKLPLRLETALSIPLRRIATESSCWLLQTVGLPAFPEGNTIAIGDQRLEVAEACAGLRMSLGIMALAYAFILLTRQPRWQKVVLALGAIPVAVLANCLRITVTGFLYQTTSNEAAEVFLHDIAGWAMIPVAAGMFALLLWLLERMTLRVPVEADQGRHSARAAAS